MAVYEGMLKAEGLKFAIVCSRFNEFFVSKLLGGALDTNGFQADGHRKI